MKPRPKRTQTSSTGKAQRHQQPKSPGDFGRTLAAKFPALRIKLAKLKLDWEYQQAALFARFVNECLRFGDVEAAERALGLVEESYPDADDFLRNTLECDFFETLDLHGPERQQLFLQLSTELQKIYRGAQEYVGRPFGGTGSSRSAD